jgi:PAS domain S-box-containing protein
VLAAVAAVGWEPYRWVSVVIDLSREERLRQLVHSEGAIVSTLLEDAPIGFALLDPELRFLRVNRELAAMNGFSVAEHEGTAVFDLLPGLRDSAEPLLRKVLETGEPLRDVEIVGHTPADPGVTHTWLESFFPVHVPHGPNVGVAAIARDVTELRGLERKLADTLRRQGEALHQLQTSLLPAVPEVTGVELSARYLAAADEIRLGGDWFDVVHAPDGRLVVSVGDVVGHGLTAVGLMARASAAMRAYISDGHPPGEVLARLNRLLHDPYSAGMASAVVMFVDLSTGALEYASAGHPFALLCGPQGTVDVLDRAQGSMLGGDPDAGYGTGTTTLAPGDSLLLYSDGLIERRGEDLDDGLARLVGCLSGEIRTRTAAGLVHDAVDVCLAGQDLSDDVCVLALTRDP